MLLGGSSGFLGGLEAFCERSMKALHERGGFEITQLRTESAHMSLGRLPAFLRGLRDLRAARNQGYDCAWVQYASLPDLCYAALARLSGMRVMITPHLGTQWRSQSNKLLRNASGRFLRAAHRLALISQTQELDLPLPSKAPRSLIRNFLPLEIIEGKLPSPPPADRPLMLVHSGRLSAGKGTFLFVDLCARLRDLGVPFAARITGTADAATMAELHDSIARYGLKEEIHVLGRVPEEDLLDLLRSADVLVHLSRIDSYPLVVLEAMACGMLPICMELAGARDMVETYAGQVVSVDNPVEEAADWLVAQNVADLRQRACHIAAQVRADYAWWRCAEALSSALIACSSGDAAFTTPPVVLPLET